MSLMNSDVVIPALDSGTCLDNIEFLVTDYDPARSWFATRFLLFSADESSRIDSWSLNATIHLNQD